MNTFRLLFLMYSFLFSKEEIEREKAQRKTTCGKYTEQLSEVEKMLETAKNDLFTLRTDAIQQREEQDNQLKGEIAHIEQSISKCFFLIKLVSSND